MKFLLKKIKKINNIMNIAKENIFPKFVAINNPSKIITKMETKLDKLIQQFEFINLFLVCLFILQIVLLFKIIS